MKLYKLSLLSVFALASFNTIQASSLEESIKDIDISGTLRYRYDTTRTKGALKDEIKGSIDGKQDHFYKAQIGFSGAIADNFKAFIQFDYDAKDGGYADNSTVNEQNPFTLRQIYLTYTNDDIATSVIAGRQQLNTIWTDNSIDGLIGTGIKVLNNSIDGLSLGAFAIDSTNYLDDKDYGSIEVSINGAKLNTPILNWEKNIYGAYALADYEILDSQVHSELWLAYMKDNALFYALNFEINKLFLGHLDWYLQGAYLGNSLDNDLKDVFMADGNLFALKGTIKSFGFDFSLGGIYYGDKDKYSVSVIEDQGNLGSLLAGEEIFYTNGSRLNGDAGRNMFGYISAGYTFDEKLRLGGDFVYGGTKTGPIHYGSKKLETVARVDYKYSPKLDFSAFYSYIQIKDHEDKGENNTVRLQAKYSF